LNSAVSRICNPQTLESTHAQLASERKQIENLRYEFCSQPARRSTKQAQRFLSNCPGNLPPHMMNLMQRRSRSADLESAVSPIDNRQIF